MRLKRSLQFELLKLSVNPNFTKRHVIYFLTEEFKISRTKMFDLRLVEWFEGLIQICVGRMVIVEISALLLNYQ